MECKRSTLQKPTRGKELAQMNTVSALHMKPLKCELSKLQTRVRMPSHGSEFYLRRHCEVSEVQDLSIEWYTKVRCECYCSLPSIYYCWRPFDHLPRPLPPPVSNSSFLFTPCQPLYASWCTAALLFKVLYCKTLNVSLFCVCFSCITCVESFIHLLQYGNT